MAMSLKPGIAGKDMIAPGGGDSCVRNLEWKRPMSRAGRGGKWVGWDSNPEPIP